MSMKIKKKPHSAAFKFKVAIESIRGEKTTAELCKEFCVVSSQIFKWKKAVLENGQEVFSKGVSSNGPNESEINQLHAKIGKLTLENDFLAKFAGKDR